MKYWFVSGSALAALSVLFGAFGAHYLKSKLTSPDLEIFEIGVRYQMYHALGIMVISIIGYELPHDLLKIPAYLLSFGTLIFSGSLYILVLTNLRWFGMITPIGGMFLVLGWLLLCLNIYRY
tara:strand:+ start:809 stop:1174 length:366 start_codon:yes stop_codon:yes gene_type:complete